MPIYEYNCSRCDAWAEKICSADERPKSVACPQCGARAGHRISMPSVHTLASHMVGVRHDSACDGSYLDPDICDPDTGEPQVVRSLKHKEELLKRYNLHIKEDSECSPGVQDRLKFNRSKPFSVS